MTTTHAAATLPPQDLPGLDRSWSRLVTAPDHRGVPTTWHLLDGHAPGREPRLTLVCVHGNPSWSYLWRDLVRAAPDDVRVLAVDQLDMGFSERTGVRRRLADRVTDLVALFDELGVDGPVVTVGHDWGGPVSLGLALELHHRGGLSGVVLSNTAVHQPQGSPAPRVIRLARTRGVLPRVTSSTSAFITGALAMSRPTPPEDVRAGYLAPYRETSRRLAIQHFVEDIPLDPSHPSAAPLDAIAAGLADLTDTPALLLWGAKDPVFSDLYLHDLEARLPHADVHRWPDASHFCPEDCDVAGAVADWLTARVAPETVVGEGVLAAPSRTQGGTDAGPMPPAPVGVGAGVAPPAEDVLTEPDASPPEDGSTARRAGAIDVGAAPARRRLWAPLTDEELADRTAVVEVVDGATSSVTFAVLGRRVRDLAAGLAAHGVRPGDRVATMVPPGADLTAVLYACWRLGAVAVLVDAGLGPRGMSRALEAANPDHLVGIDRALVAARALGWPGERIAASDVTGVRRRLLGATTTLADLAVLGAGTATTPPEPTPDAEAVVVFTSGSTGPSKGVVYRHRQLEAQRDQIRARYGITPDDALVAAFAPFALLAPALGITSVVPDMDVTEPGTMTAAALAEAAAAVEATMVFASPAALKQVAVTADALSAAQREALGAVRVLLSAGAAVHPDVLAAAVEVMPGAEAHTPYGMTECLPVADISLTDLAVTRGGDGVCVGRPLDGVEVRISPLDDDDGEATGELVEVPGVVGEVVVRAAHAKDRYDRLWWTEHRASQPAGWHRTGDVGHLDDDGMLWIGGRLVHLLSTPEGPVTPVAPEVAAETVDEVRLAACVGVGPPRGQAVAIVVQLHEPSRTAGLADLTLTDAVRDAVAAAGRPVPAAVLVVPRLPVDRRHEAKVDRTRVAAWAERVLAGGRVGTP